MSSEFELLEKEQNQNGSAKPPPYRMRIKRI